MNGEVEAVSGVMRRPVWKGSRVRMVRWRCCAERAGSTGVLLDPWYVVSFTHTGSFLLTTRGQSEMIDATRAMLIRPGEPFQMTRCNDSVASGSAVSVHPSLVEALAGTIPDSITRVSAPVTAFLLQHLLLRRAAAGDDPDLEEAALWVAAATLRAPAGQGTPARETAREPIRDVQGLLARRFNEPVRLEEVAHGVNRSLHYLCRAFKRGTGLPMHHYLNRLRLRASLESVIDPAANLAALAIELGFSSHSHFGEAFRNEFRVTPTEVRRIAALPRLAAVRSALERGGPASPW